MHRRGHQQVGPGRHRRVELVQAHERTPRLRRTERFHVRDELANVLRRGAAAAADDVDAEFADEF